MNIVLIISDSFRRDYLGFYGRQSIHTPHLDEFAGRCQVFDRAYCASFPTMPTRADLLTGRFTFTYQGWGPLAEEEVVLPRLFTDAGYRTMGVVDTPFYLRRGYGYDRGFDDFKFIKGQEPGDADTTWERRYEEDYAAPRSFAAAERWLERHYKDDFFLLVDTWDPHEPWDPPAHYVERYLPGWDGTVVWPSYWYCRERDSPASQEQLGTMQALWTEWSRRTSKARQPGFIVNEGLGLAFAQAKPSESVIVGETEEHIKIARACYSGEVTMVDRAVGRFIDRIESLGILDRTVVIFTADHGFLFGEHGIFGKSIMHRGGHVRGPLYELIAGVPLLVYLPGAPHRRLNALVSLPDLMPTILDLAGVGVPQSVQAESFLPVLSGAASKHRDFVVSTMPLRNPGEYSRAVDDSERLVEEFMPATITTDRWSMLFAHSGAPVEIYDLDVDPGQENNVASKHRDTIADLHGRYIGFLEEMGTAERLIQPRRTL